MKRLQNDNLRIAQRERERDFNDIPKHAKKSNLRSNITMVKLWLKMHYIVNLYMHRI